MSTTRIPKKGKSLTLADASFAPKEQRHWIYIGTALIILCGFLAFFSIGYMYGKRDGVTESMHYISVKISEGLDQPCFEQLMKALKGGNK